MKIKDVKERFAIEVIDRYHRRINPCPVIKRLYKSELADSIVDEIIRKYFFEIEQDNDGIGTKTYWKCNCCDSEIDVTNYDNY
jgi:hypothetical protein